jgi:subtilase family serine protease
VRRILGTGMCAAVLLLSGLSATSIGVAGSSAGGLTSSLGRSVLGPRFRPPPGVGHVPSLDPPTEEQCEATMHVPCYGPTQLEAAYDERPLFARGVTGAGTTIVIVDSFGAPTIASNLATFDDSFGLRPPPSFRIIQPVGPVTFNPTTTTMLGWAGETTLDVEYSHAIAPGANILLVETPTSETEGVTGFPTIVAAENYVIDHHLGDVISQSFGTAEEDFASPTTLLALRSAYVNAQAQGVTVLAAAGDTGASTTTVTGKNFTYPVVGWPASDPLVTAVGGTQLDLKPTGARVRPDQVWNDTYDPLVVGPQPVPFATGGGVSSVFSRPSYQDGEEAVVGSQRGIPDISMSAACSAPVLTYGSIDGRDAGWTVVCGTSEASPLFAGIVALADQEAHHSLGFINPALYAMSAAGAPGIVDVTKGNNSVSFYQTGVLHNVTGYAAHRGYNLACGVGTVNAALFVPELVRAVAEAGSNTG